APSGIGGIASCRSAPTTSARTSRPRARRSSACSSRRSTARTRSSSSASRRARASPPQARWPDRPMAVTTPDDPALAPGPAPVPSVEAPPATQPRAWRHRHLLDVDVLTTAEIDLVMRTTDAMAEVLARPIPKVPALRGTAVTILFYEASTRTRVSFEVAAKNLSADVVNITASASSVTKGESLVDTVRTIEALGADMLVMRHERSGSPYLAASVFGGSVLNGGDGWHAHPTQALLDLYTLR